MTQAGDTSWIVCQIGAREHYAVARGLARAGADVRLITDYWAGAGDGTSAMNRRLKQRCHSEIDDDRVTSFNFGFLRTELVAKIRRLKSWDRYQFSNDWFGRKAAGRLRKMIDTHQAPPTVFAYSYAAKSIFSEAKRLGCRTVLGQIDPGPEEDRIVGELDRKAGLSSYVPANESYWDDWRKECESADVVVANSNWSCECLIQSGLAAEKIRVVELGFEPSIALAPSGDVDTIPSALMPVAHCESFSSVSSMFEKAQSNLPTPLHECRIALSNGLWSGEQNRQSNVASQDSLRSKESITFHEQRLPAIIELLTSLFFRHTRTVLR